MRFGICTPVENAAAVKAAGWDFVEENVQGLLQGNLADDAWQGAERARGAALPIVAANCLVPGNMKITGPTVDLPALEIYMERVVARAQQLGLKTLVFGSGGARQVADGVDRDTARRQILIFLRLIPHLLEKHGVTLVVEPLHRAECNIINTVADAMTYVEAINHPKVRCLLDSYHFWMDDEPFENLHRHAKAIAHVHVADKIGRTPPGESGKADYRPLFAILKKAGYDGDISVEASGFTDIAGVGPRVLQTLKEQWGQA